MLTVEDVIDTHERNVGETIRVRWTIPVDAPLSGLTIDADPGPSLTGDDVEKRDVGPSDAWGGRDAWEYRAEITLEAAITDLTLSIPGEARRVERVTATP